MKRTEIFIRNLLFESTLIQRGTGPEAPLQLRDGLYRKKIPPAGGQTDGHPG